MSDKNSTMANLLNVTVFFCGALVMVYEIIGSRIVSPFIGSSTYVWTSLIGVILGALSLGYWLGGKLADRKPDVKILAAVIFFAGGAVAMTVLVKDLLLTAISSADIGTGLKSILASLFLFAPASVLLGFVTPYVVRLKMSALAETGQTVGRIYAVSTVGSIVGTFAAGFFLIPFVGSVRTLYLIASILFLLSVLLVSFKVTRLNIALLTLFVIAIFISEASIYHLRESSGLFDIDTEYSRVQVFQTTEPKSGRRIQTLATDPYFLQSAMFLDGDEMVFDYTQYYDLAAHFTPGVRKTLMIGGAGYSYPKEYLRKYPESKIDVVEIDPQMTAIARRFFRLTDNNNLSIYHEDGRAFLNAANEKQYDTVLMDAFGSLFSVPYQLTTVEAVSRINHVLKDDGVVIFNLGSAIKGDASKFLQAEFQTYKSVFPYVYLFKVKPEFSDDRLQNLIIIAGKSENMSNFATSDIATAKLLSNLYATDLPLEQPILTDDLAAVEYYNSVAQIRYAADRKMP